MRLPSLPAFDARSGGLPLWPPLLATRGAGSKSELHAHHALHVVLAVEGELAVRSGPGKPWRRAAGVVTAPDVAHAVDATGVEVLLVFLDPESDDGRSLAELLGGTHRLVSSEERDALVRGADARAIVLGPDGARFTRAALATLGAEARSQDVGRLGGGPARRSVHPRVRRLLKMLSTSSAPIQKQISLERLAREAGLSPGRLMHVFTESVGIPLRPYLAWLKLQRAAGAIVSGVPLAQAAQAAGFSDAAHMTRTFRRMFGVAPSALRPPKVAAS